MEVVVIPQRNPTEVDLEAVAIAFKALSDPARLRILLHLKYNQNPGACCGSGSEGAICACDLEAVTGLSQPTVSHHMKALVAANLVRAEKRGKWMYYQLDLKGFAFLQNALEQFETP